MLPKGFSPRVTSLLHSQAVADPGFPRRGGANFQSGGANLLFGQIFTQNCMKMKEFGPRGGGARPWRHPLDPPMPRDVINVMLPNSLV